MGGQSALLAAAVGPTFPPPQTPSASLRSPPRSITGTVVFALDSEATPLLATVARKGKLALAKRPARKELGVMRRIIWGK